MIWMIIFLIVGFILLVKGADLFVDGACDLSEKLKIPAYIVGLTVVAFGTSLPEAAVSITASIQGSNEIAIGNIIGSNIFNTLVVLGASALFMPIAVKKDVLKRDFPFNIIITVLLLVLLLTLSDGVAALTRFDGIILLAVFALFMTYSVIAGKKQSAQMEQNEAVAEVPMWKCIIYILIGIVGVIAGGQLTVKGAVMMAEQLGMSETVIGLTVVAIGTSLPELVTSVVAAFKKQADIAVGNVVGSNIFNLLFILGASATIGTIKPEINPAADIYVLLGISVLTYLISLIFKKINRPSGIVMILVYAAYTAWLLVR